MPSIWRSSYSSGLDIVQQNYQKLALDRVQEFKQINGGLGFVQGLSMISDMYNNTTDKELQTWAEIMINKLAKDDF